MANLSREDVVEAAKRAAQQAGTRTLSRGDFVRLTGISRWHISKLFPEGGWVEIRHLAGLGPDPMLRKKYHWGLSDDHLLAEFHRVVLTHGGIPTWAIFDARANISASAVTRRFGGRTGTLKRYRTWLEEYEPASPIPSPLRVPAKRELSSAPPPDSVRAPVRTAGWSKASGAEYGPPISFRGLRHAPINELGVVFLFGMVSDDLGFLVEAIHAAYPDCEAKRCVDRRGDRWQRVRIEFEYRSSNFRGHDPAGCDLIVCWEHDWSECPLEVVELRNVINGLKG